jgi:actin-related protein 6
MSRPVFVVDNGAGVIKAGFAGENAPRITIGNCCARSKGKPLFGTLEPSADVSNVNFRIPHDRGYLVNSPLQKEIWSYLFAQPSMQANIRQSTLVITEPLFDLAACQQNLCELVFEKFGFHSFVPVNAASMVAEYDAQKIGVANDGWCGVVVDSGFSFTHAIPVHRSQPILPAVRRLNVGGKLMTNYLKGWPEM